MRRVGAVGLVCVTVLGVVTSAAGAAERPRPRGVTVIVEDRRVRLPAERATPVRALREIGVVPRDGALRSAATGGVLDPLLDHGYVLVNGVPASMDTRLRSGWRVDVHDGVDVVEETATRQVVLPYANQDKVGQPGWLPGAEGLAEEVYGTISGELVARTVVRAPVAAVEVRVPTVSVGSSVYLTFDDGPDPTWTPQVLDVLRANGVKATFCMVGRYVAAHPDLARRVVAEGHAPCNHSQSHARLDTLGADGVESEIAAASTAIESATGQRPAVFRVPYGRSNATVVSVAAKLGLPVLGWTVDPSDYTRPGVDQIVARVSQAVRPGAIVLFHDGGSDRSQTVAALARLVPALRDAGYSFGRP